MWVRANRNSSGSGSGRSAKRSAKDNKKRGKKVYIFLYINRKMERTKADINRKMERTKGDIMTDFNTDLKRTFQAHFMNSVRQNGRTFSCAVDSFREIWLRVLSKHILRTSNSELLILLENAVAQFHQVTYADTGDDGGISYEHQFAMIGEYV